ncbi:MAG: glycosyltransferase [Oligoflexales bacterium]|nr:glycosyltransferase [Oligoflexales bacterium]
MSLESNLAPIVLFVYNRPEYTRRTINALQKNLLAIESDLFIYSDAPKNESEIGKVKEVRSFIRSISGFKNITVIEREKNWGLADSIIDGVTNTIKDYKKVIVLEDDLETSPYFLHFMNENLAYYKDKKTVWHISGWNYPFNFDVNEDLFLIRVMSCWGWGTWDDRWQHFEKNTDQLVNDFSKNDIKRFNLDGCYDLWNQVLANKSKKINTWAIYWYATIFKKNGLCINPVLSYVRNIGLDGTGENCTNNPYEKFSSLNNSKDIKFPDMLEENPEMLSIIKNGFKKIRKNYLKRLIKKIRHFKMT